MASRPDSDVDRLSLEILPSLRHRVIIHLDDIPFPYLAARPDHWIFRNPSAATGAGRRTVRSRDDGHGEADAGWSRRRSVRPVRQACRAGSRVNAGQGPPAAITQVRQPHRCSQRTARRSGHRPLRGHHRAAGDVPPDFRGDQTARRACPCPDRLPAERISIWVRPDGRTP